MYHTGVFMQIREKFSSRFGFIIVSVSCAVGLGNIWLLPYRAGTYGGGLYILLFLGFAILMGIPILTTEYGVGRGSGKSVAEHYQVLQPPGSKWHIASYFQISGNYLLIMFYAVVCGQALAYLVKGITGELIGASPEEIAAAFGALTGSAVQSYGYTLAIVWAGFAIVYFGVQKGVEFFGKYMMLTFFGLIIILIIRSLTLPGATAGLEFIFIPNLDAVNQYGWFYILHRSMGQALFSLSVGMGSMAVFGSYINKEKSLLGEARTVGIIDLCVSMLCLLMIFPAAFAFGISPATGGGLTFITMPNIFNAMPGSYIWSLLFYLGLTFVSASTAFAVFENLVAILMDKLGWSRKKSTLVNVILISFLIMPASFGTNIWRFSAPLFGQFPNFSAMWSFIVSDIILPLGSLVYITFAATKKGWGWDHFIAEVNTGEGLKMPAGFRFYFTYIIPVAIAFVFILGIIGRFFPGILW